MCKSEEELEEVGAVDRDGKAGCAVSLRDEFQPQKHAMMSVSVHTDVQERVYIWLRLSAPPCGSSQLADL